jgi:hypothetical protein
MNRDVPFAARIAFRLPQALYDKLEIWADEEDRPLANLIYTVVKQAVTERERAELAHAGETGEAR